MNDNEAFEKVMQHLIDQSGGQWGVYRDDIKYAWQAAITECQAICGNQYDFLKDAMERLK